MGFLNSYMGSLQQNYEMAKECLEINFYGTKDVTDCLMPLLLSNSGKVINLTSKISQLQVTLSMKELYRITFLLIT
jgi:short-subunit dehydrogenase